MKAMDFIDSVVPRGGTYCVIGIKGKSIKQQFADSLNDTRKLIKENLDEQRNTYFALASFKDNTSRTQKNVSELKAFWLDLDCYDPEKVNKNEGYPDKVSAMQALVAFIDDVGLPQPAIVDSGGGWHVYWRLESALSKDKWQPIADMFKAVCLKKKLAIDPRVPADGARVLRVPGTYNFNKEAKVQFLEGVDIPDPIPLTQFESPVREAANALGVSARIAPLNFTPREMDETTKHLLGNKGTKFSTVAKKSLSGEGCAQIAHMLQNPKDTHYDLWCAGLSIAVRCEDGPVAIHKLSKNHPGYSPETTEFKADEFNKPPYSARRCDWFEANFPDRCEGCKHKGNITSPIQLGAFIRQAESNEVPLPVIPETVSEEAAPPPSLPTSIKFPKLPFPYFRGINGGIYTTEEAADGEKRDILVYENDLFVMKRVRDEEDGEVLLINLILPMDGLQEFYIPLKHIAAQDKLRDALAHHGVSAGKKRMEAIMSYIIASNKELQRHMKLEMSRPSFGWYDNKSVFVIGKREITANGERYSPPSAHTSMHAGYLEPFGDFDKWKSVMEVLGRPGWEYHQIVALAAFGAPLMQLIEENGVLLNMWASDSGTGKTTVQHFINSVYGQTEHLMLRKTDTLAARYHRLGVMRNLPVCMDEITNMLPLEFSDLAYSFHEGRARNRLKANENKERVNNSFWKTIGVGSSNSVMSDKLTVNKATAAGELHRIFEFHIQKPEELENNFAQSLAKTLKENYGHAGDMYLKALVKDPNGANKLVDKVKRSLNSKLKTTSSERVWVASFACMFAGGYIARALGIINWDIDTLVEVLVRLLKQRREETAESQIDLTQVLGEFISANKGAILQINGDSDARSGLPQAPIYNPTVRVVGRYEPDTNKLFIILAEFKQFCERRQIPFSAASQSSPDGMTYLGRDNVRLLTGTGVSASPVRCLIYSGQLAIPQGEDDETTDSAADS